MVQLDPATFVCPSHQVDLTPHVRELLEEEEGPPIAYGRRGLLGGRARKREFEVVVPCPGDGTPDSAHDQACEGRYWT